MQYPGYPQQEHQAPFPVQQQQRIQQQKIQSQQTQQQQVYLQYYQHRLHQQQAMARQYRGQPLDAAQGREAGRQLLSLIGVVPKLQAEKGNADAHQGHFSPPSMSSPMDCEKHLAKPTLATAADQERQLMHQQNQQQQLSHMQQQLPPLRNPCVNPHFPPGTAVPSLQLQTAGQGGFAPLDVHGSVLGCPPRPVGAPSRPHGHLLSRGDSGERNLLKLLHAGGGPVGISPEDVALPQPPGGLGRGSL